MAIKDTATDFELPQDNQIIFEDASVADIENMLEGEVELLPIQADTKVSRLPTVETVEMLAEEVPLKPIKAEEITIPQPAASAVSAKMLLGLSALLGGGAVLAAAGKSSGGGESKKQPVSEKNVPQQDDRENSLKPRLLPKKRRLPRISIIRTERQPVLLLRRTWHLILLRWSIRLLLYKQKPKQAGGILAFRIPVRKSSHLIPTKLLHLSTDGIPIKMV